MGGAYVLVTALTGDGCGRMLRSMSEESSRDAASETRRARYGKLPERIRFESMTEGVAPAPGGDPNDPYNPEGAWKFYNCLAVDLGL
ncbi:hypothetical protein ATKI12_3728 [Kitasatospora sp. Ki12]